MALFDFLKKKKSPPKEKRVVEQPSAPVVDEPHLGLPLDLSGAPPAPVPGKSEVDQVNEHLAKFTSRSPEELCGIEAGMSPEEIKERLARLFKRHNRGASSLDPKTSAEAEIMLDAIVVLREKFRL